VIQDIEVQPVTFRSVHQVKILLMDMEMNLGVIALVVESVTIALALVGAFLDFSEHDVNTKQLYFKVEARGIIHFQKYSKN